MNYNSVKARKLGIKGTILREIIEEVMQEPEIAKILFILKILKEVSSNLFYTEEVKQGVVDIQAILTIELAYLE
jgi:hypothetical protein